MEVDANELIEEYAALLGKKLAPVMIKLDQIAADIKKLERSQSLAAAAPAAPVLVAPGPTIPRPSSTPKTDTITTPHRILIGKGCKKKIKDGLAIDSTKIVRMLIQLAMLEKNIPGALDATVSLYEDSFRGYPEDLGCFRADSKEAQPLINMRLDIVASKQSLRAILLEINATNQIFENMFPKVGSSDAAKAFTARVRKVIAIYPTSLENLEGLFHMPDPERDKLIQDNFLVNFLDMRLGKAWVARLPTESQAMIANIRPKPTITEEMLYGDQMS
jgi:hypothetical protein